MTNMITISLPDGQKKEFQNGVSAEDVAKSISPSLAKASMVARVDGKLWDLRRPIQKDCQLALLTNKDTEDLELLEVVRHTCAHVLAQAVKEIWGDDVQVTIGPSIADGFYYDFATKEPFSEKDLENIEKKMRQIIDRNDPIERLTMSRKEAVALLESKKEDYKVEIVQDIDTAEDLSFYQQGPFMDLCRGPHLPSTGKVGKAFRLQRLAGSYWRGDSTKAQLQRIYGTAWLTEQQLEAYLHRLEEAAKRDHRKLGPQMGLFHLQEEAAGQVFWHYSGYRLYQKITTYIERLIHKNDYQSVKTPMVVDRKLWEESGHWDKFRENMFLVHAEDETDRLYALKPMNCPGHIQIFKQGIKSYRDLPIRMAEFGSCHRYEPSGALHGIMRLRGFVQDDGHIFCRADQVKEETISFCLLLKKVYSDMGFDSFSVKLSTRPEKRAGDDATWDKAEKELGEATKAAGLDFEISEGEGAFYGPKLEFVLTDTIGRDWQCGTIQLDFVLPQRLKATYIDKQGDKQTPVMLHRAVLGSVERFLAILLEHYAGHLPLWLAPTAAVVAPISEGQNDYAKEVFDLLKKEEIEAELDTKNEKISYKVRQHSERKVPFVVIVGDKEKEARTVSLRQLGQKETSSQPLEEFVTWLKGQVQPPL